MNPADFSIEEYRAFLLDEGLVRRRDQAGCSGEEIDEVMRAQGVERIPGLYRDFLRVMGRSPHPLMTGTDWTYDALLRIKESAVLLLEEDGADPAILDDALVIALHQGYIVYYIPHVGAAPDDPEVWVYVEAERPKRTASTFREFLLVLADDRRKEMGVHRDLEATGRFTMMRIGEGDG